MASPLFVIEDLHVSTAGENPVEILRGVDLTIGAGEVHALMGPNGSGKSTLASSLLGSPEYEVTSGRILFKGEDITSWPTDVRAKSGMFLAFQYPQEIQGVSVLNFLRQAWSARRGIDLSMLELRLSIMEWMGRLDMDPSFADRYLNEGFSGGEKKRNEILQMAILEPEIAILDETDSGLDIDALRVVAKGVREVRSSRSELGILAITRQPGAGRLAARRMTDRRLARWLGRCGFALAIVVAVIAVDRLIVHRPHRIGGLLAPLHAAR
jgi:Fe-S cluster assembly ATP-binding protein